MTTPRMILYLDGIPQAPTDVDGLQEGTFTRAIQQDGQVATNYSQPITLRGAAYHYLRKRIFESPAPALALVQVTIQDTTLRNTTPPHTPYTWMIGHLKGADATHDPIHCTITAPIIDADRRSQRIQCLRNTLIWSRAPRPDGTTTDGENTHRRARYLPYCVDNDAREPLLILGIIFKVVLMPVIYIVAALIAIINGIIAAVNLLPGVTIDLIDMDGNEATNPFQEATQLITLLNEQITGCGRRHKVVYLHSYLSNLCEACGLTLQSRIFQPETGHLYHVARLDASYHKGGRNTDEIEDAWQHNKPNLTGTQLLDELSENLALTWDVTGHNSHLLTIDRPSDFQHRHWIDLRDLPRPHLLALQLSITERTPPAMGIIEYVRDGIDTAGDDIARNIVDTLIDFNDPPSPTQRGHLQKTIMYGAAQFRYDRQASRTSPLDLERYAVAFTDLSDYRYQHALVLGRHTISTPKLIVLNHRQRTHYTTHAQPAYYAWGNMQYDYNVPLWIKATPYMAPDSQARDTLYQATLSQLNPRIGTTYLQPYTLELVYDREMLDALDTYGINQSITLLDGRTARVEEVTIDPRKGTMSIKGHV